MMQLCLIGGNSALKISDLVGRNFDNVDVGIFKSIEEFYAATSARSIVVDRLILLQDAVNSGLTEEKLHSFNDYLGKHYPSIRLVTVMNSKESVELFANIFISPLMTHILVDKMKPKMLNDIVSERPEILQAKYSYKPEDASSGVVSEIIDEIKDTVVPEQPSKPEGKKGFFSRFGNKKDKKRRSGKHVNKQVAEMKYTPLDVDSPESQEDSIDNSGQDVVDSEAEEMIDEIISDASDEVDFSVFEGNTQLGVGVDIDRLRSQQNQSDIDNQHDTKQEDTIVKEDEDSFDETDPFDDNDSSTEHIEPIIGLELHYSQEDNQSEDAVENVDVAVLSQERKDKLNELKSSVFNKKLSIDIDSIKTPGILQDDIAITDADHTTPIFDNIEGMSDEYDKQSTPVIEKVVERVVERIVNTGTPKHNYKNGVRVVLVTGDRKTGVTRTALNLASSYSKESNTLFVDFDIDRKGSLLYLGLENIVGEDDVVQNGINFTNSVNVLPSVVYQFGKGGFDCLLSMYGGELDEDRLRGIQRILSLQRTYKTIIIDCPMENLSYFEDILVYSEVLVCIDTELPCVLNTLLGLNDTFSDERQSSFLFNSSKFLITKGSDQVELSKGLAYIVDLFSLDKEAINWGLIPIIGSTVDFKLVVELLK